jgi:hypothetical protein
MKPLDSEQRYDIAEAIAQQWTDNQDPIELENYYFASQMDYLIDLTDAELLELAQSNGVKND